jgi:hypothetical protein
MAETTARRQRKQERNGQTAGRHYADQAAAIFASGQQAGREEAAKELEQLRARLFEVQQKQEQAETALLAKPATATPPPGGHCQQALQPTEAGVVRLWVFTHDNGYRITWLPMIGGGPGWQLAKWTDSTLYHVRQDGDGELVCDCPGFVAHGPTCNNGKSCKHCRIIRGLRIMAQTE